MPMLDAYIPEGALTEAAEQKLLSQLTDILIKHEGVDHTNPRVRSLAWIFLHRPHNVWVAGEKAKAPHYKFITSVPEGQFNRERREGMIAAVTNAVLDAEDGTHPRQPERIWVHTPEVPEGSWGHAGTIFGLAEIAGFALEDAEKGKAYAKAVLANRRYETNQSIAG